MPIPILMPALSPTMEEGVLAKWHVREGDSVSSGDVIAEIETDKATMEVEAVDEGVVGKILVEEGAEGVKVNAPIAVLLEEGENAEDIAEVEIGAAKAETNGAGGNGAAAAPPPEPKATPTPASTTRPAPQTPSGGRVFASPLARRLAKNEGLDLARLKGSGPHGRIVKRDVEKALAEGGAKAPVAEARAPESAPATLDDRLYPPDSYVTKKLDGMRKVIAKRLTQSFRDVPHFPLTIDCRLDNLLAMRKRVNAMSPEGEGAFKVSVNDFVIKAAALALSRVPEANATYTDEAIILHKHADIGMAVAIDGGLITPIIWKAETKGLKQISEETKDLAKRARDRKLKPEEYQGGTFSVSNLGMFGIREFASIINTPQGAIMSVGAGEQRPVVQDGALAVATVMSVTLTCDHRVVDGAVGAAFLAEFKKFIEDPIAMIL